MGEGTFFLYAGRCGSGPGSIALAESGRAADQSIAGRNAVEVYRSTDREVV